ncbi:hypothetical protein CPB83DRAFT_865565 [Crepidotus variabilis]|uniref:Uncharacterized protein n=1 Tax=Crepidotus variabilis TaxID=179855 RepID=A0A9P6E2T8_9AGAR|nr:hypothetical protein CPB83DRAFT_865565 [Crepidotus variabilis]
MGAVRVSSQSRFVLYTLFGHHHFFHNFQAVIRTFDSLASRVFVYFSKSLKRVFLQFLL